MQVPLLCWPLLAGVRHQSLMPGNSFIMHACCCCCCNCCALQDGPAWLQIFRLLRAPEPLLQLAARQHQQHLQDTEELQQLRARVAELERPSQCRADVAGNQEQLLLQAANNSWN